MRNGPINLEVKNWKHNGKAWKIKERKKNKENETTTSSVALLFYLKNSPFFIYFLVNYLFRLLLCIFLPP